MQDPKRFDALSTVVFLVGVAEGIVPFAAKLTDWWTPIFALPLYLDPPPGGSSPDLWRSSPSLR